MNLRKYCPVFVFPLLQKAGAIKNIAVFNYFKLTKHMNSRKILMLSVSRSTLSGNLEFIYRKLDKGYFDIKVVLENDGTETTELLKEMAQAKFIIIDDYTKLVYPLTMRKGAHLIQVWHSTGAFKRMGFARMGRSGSTVRTSLTHRNYTDVIVSSPFVVKDFALAFGIDEKCIHPVGVPRTDVFFDERYKKNIIKKIKSTYPVLNHKKLILFAPTFRGNTRDDAYYPEEFIDIKSLYEHFHNEYILGIKLHPFIKKKIKAEKKYADFILDLSDNREINDLLFITDILVTDYSSVIFEYALLRKKAVFYAPDLEDYVRDRDFFYNYDEYIYGAFAQNKEELINAIDNANIDEDKLSQFTEKFLSSCDGKSTDRFINLIMEEEKNEKSVHSS